MNDADYAENRFAAIKTTDIANGPGVRVSVFLSGCPHHCHGCFNKEAWDYNYGTKITDDTLKDIEEYLNKPYIQGLTILGGEPFDPKNIDATRTIASIAKGLNKDVWIYTGYTLDEIISMMFSMPYSKGKTYCTVLLDLCNVLVDGRFNENLADKRLLFRGSSNQRLIDMEATAQCGKIVLWQK